MVKEKELIKAVLEGDQKAFRTLVEQYQRLVSHIVFRLVHNEADREDICQDVFIKAYQSLARFQFESKFSTWIARIAYNTSVNYLKKKKVPLFDDMGGDENSIDDFAGDSGTPSDFAVEEDLSQKLDREVERLPAQYRAILTLYHLDEMRYAEISEILGLPEGTVKSYLFRARRMLKERLMAQYHQEELCL